MAWAASPNAPEAADITVVSSKDEKMLASAKAYAQKMHDAHQFTDTSQFQLRCLVCGQTVRVC